METLPKWRNLGLWAWFKPRIEILVPVIGLVLFLLMNGSGDRPAGLPVLAGICVLAGVYSTLIVRTPKFSNPAKQPQQIEKQDAWKTLGQVALVVIGAAAIAILTSMSSQEDSESSSSLGMYLIILLIIIGTATAGLLAEKTLPVDLLPLFRQRDLNRVLYVLSAALFITMLVMIVGGILSSNIGQAVSSLVGETPPTQDAGEGFDRSQWPFLLLDMLIGAGLFEELLFRAGVMTLVWKLTKRWGWGLLISAVLFGFYHITLSSLSNHFLEAPAYSVVSSAVMGLILGCIYRYRGLSMVILVHALNNFVGLMMFS
jgi:membrane protease YdiL (CAAX protease family)